MTSKEFEHVLQEGETDRVEFKSWKKAKSQKEIISLAVDELIAFANHKGGTVYFGVEDEPIVVSGCDSNYDSQKIIEGIYDKTRPPLFTELDSFQHDGKLVIAISVKSDGNTYATTDGRCLKRLGKNSKPFYPDEMGRHYTSDQSPDFSLRIIRDSSMEDVDKLEIFRLKEKLRVRDSKSTLPDQDDFSFLRDMGFTKVDAGIDKLTVTGLLFVGKETSIQRLLPQAEVVYLHYSEKNLEEYDARLDMKLPLIRVIDQLTEKIQNIGRIENIQVGLFRLEVEEFSQKVFQEALLNALAHRDYQSTGAVYVKHYPDKIVIESPGGFPADITVHNIITHPSVPRNKLIAETLQRLKYVQRTGQGVDIIFKEMVSTGKPYPKYTTFADAVSLTIYNAIDDKSFVKFLAEVQEKQQRILSLAEMMVLRSLTEVKQLSLSDIAGIIQLPLEEARRTCSYLIKSGLLELSGRDYMLTASTYTAVKNDISYTRDKKVRYIKAKNMIMEYLNSSDQITNPLIQELCGFTRQQARIVIDKMRAEGLLELCGKGPKAFYIRKQ